MQALYRKDIACMFGVDLRTVDRWKHDKILPMPSRIAGRPYWTEAQIDKHTRLAVKNWNNRERTRAMKAAKLHRTQRRNVATLPPPSQLSLPLK